MITRGKFENFKALRNVEITFDSRLTVLVGPNGSGKTSVLQGIQFLGRSIQAKGGPQQFFVPMPPRGSLTVYGWQDDPVTLIDEQILSNARLTIETHHPGETDITCYYRGLKDNDLPVQHYFSYRRDKQIIEPTNPSLSQLRSAIHLELDPVQLRRPSFLEKIPPALNPDGSGLASLLAHIKRKHPDEFQAINDSLKQVIPSFELIRIDYEQFNSNPKQFPDVLIFDFKNASDVRAASVSDGTIIVLGLLSVIFGPNQPKLILLDDLDHRLHPKAQMNLVELLHKLLDQFPDLQIIATAHSPYILDRLEWSEVRVTALNDDGSAMCKPLSDHPDFERWKESMSPGEFWSTFYEDWLTKTREPQPVP
jgi:predicted ATPase